MTLTLTCSSLHPAMPVFSRTLFSIPMCQELSLPCGSYGSRTAKQWKKLMRIKATVAEAVPDVWRSVAGNGEDGVPEKKKLRVLVAGGGIGGLVFSLAAKRKGFDVVVFEKDMSAIRGEGQYRGPIQIQSNALAALEAIDFEAAEEVLRVGCITGDRINGLVDGVSGSWYIKFDTFTPAAERGLPVTRVISRMALQEILARAVGEDSIMNESNVVDFVDHGDKVTVELENGQKYDGDLLVGADGIWSKVRNKLFGEREATYSGYTCYTGVADFVPADIESVGYRVFLGHKQYFVSSDVGAGKTQWYAFHQESAGGSDIPNGKKKRLLKMFEGWCDNVIDVLVATEEEAILRRDIYDRTPTFTWGKGRVTLLGDSIHAMQPNMGQGGCMAIEDSYQLALELGNAWEQSIKSGSPIDIDSSLKSYERERRLRVAIVHGMARMAALMASTYRAYLGVGLGPFEFLTKFRIPHPGRVGGRFLIDKMMPLMLNWVLGGNSSKLEGRPICCRLSDKANDQLQTWFEDNDALERAINGEWILLPCDEAGSIKPISLSQDEMKPCIIGSSQHEDHPGSSIIIPLPKVSPLHARINYKDGAFFLTDLRSLHGTWITDNEGRRYRIHSNYPSRVRPSDVIEFGSDKASFRVKVTRSAPRESEKKGTKLYQKE
ncbi:zeaxanthin epoxidase, chloroplastic-like isoform X1 [Vigna umbellata]|uniref:zeaxanthin epoxidase, chloroplastic-like isoform X1 n=2 Tax=Vigna umbellata TaxID=87088 RepID=UPI001F5E46AA|nr:zeaxanthin epoxidase, chloroplastic-like isoform X1 [Vigna umbellata]